MNTGNMTNDEADKIANFITGFKLIHSNTSVNEKEKTGMDNLINKTWLDHSVYCGENLQLYHGDCLDVMDLMIEDNTKVDMILCDLPYGTTACKWDTIIPFEKLWERYDKLIKQNGAIVLFGSQPFTSALIMSNINLFKYELIWEKSNPTGMGQSNKRPMKYHENIIVFYKSQPTYNKQMIPRTDKTVSSMIKNGGKFNVSNTMSGNQQSVAYKDIEAQRYSPDEKNPSSVIKCNSIRPISREYLGHPTQKPILLIETLIKTYTNKGELVLDNCIGSGTTAAACQNTDRHCIGIEKDKPIYDIAVKRLNDIWVSKQNRNELF